MAGAIVPDPAVVNPGACLKYASAGWDQSSTQQPLELAYCLHDNETLARYLVSDFVSISVPTRDWQVLSLIYQRLDAVAASGDPASTYCETVRAGDPNVRLTWSGLGEPFCFALPPDKSARGSITCRASSSEAEMPP